MNIVYKKDKGYNKTQKFLNLVVSSIQSQPVKSVVRIYSTVLECGINNLSFLYFCHKTITNPNFR